MILRHSTALPSAGPRGQRGFSLAEVIVVVAIILIASTFALSAYSTHTKSHAVRATAQTVSRALIEAKSRAIMLNGVTRLSLDLDNQSFWIDEMDGSGGVAKPKIVPPKSTETGIIMVDVQVGSTTSSTGIVQVSFDAQGNNEYIKVTLRRSSDDATNNRNYYTVQLHPSSDDPRILPNERR